MKQFQIILKNEYTISPRGIKEHIQNNEEKINNYLKEGYIVKKLNTESNNFHSGEYKSSPNKKIYFVEIYVLELHQNI